MRKFVLEGFGEPVESFSELEELEKKLYRTDAVFEPWTLSIAVGRLSGHLSNKGIETLDGYSWYAGAFFPFPHGKAAILFPWSHREKDTLKLDRRVSAFADNKISKEELPRLVRNLVNQIQPKTSFSRFYPNEHESWYDRTLSG